MSSPAMDVTPGLDDSQFITVKCRQCSSHYPLREINKHMLQCVKTSKCVGWESMDSHKDTVDDEILCLDSDDTSGDEFPDITKPPPKKGNGHFESKWNFVRLLAIILKVCRTEVARRKPFEEADECEDNTKKEEQEMKEPNFQMNDIIQPTCKNTNNEDPDELFETPRHIIMARRRESVYEEYCRHPQEMYNTGCSSITFTVNPYNYAEIFPKGITLPSLRVELQKIEPYLRRLCKTPDNVRWKTFLKASTEKQLQHAINKHVTTWQFEHPGVVNEMRCFVTSICEDEFPGLTVNPIRMSEHEILPEAIISLIQCFYGVTYEEAAIHYIQKTIP
ncbi:hypothetical protein GBAR_LOCUS16630 [Geodia barretti]|uniref:Uncharacterized protein n=1 Tax=Geodia barretti TaxID=519541 RepID=A0AA35WWJ8_GEOBA|nr:hypothetical protein GBAR_LOCUS16630 [Geodia barretti]